MKFKNIALTFFAFFAFALLPCSKCFAADNSEALKKILNPSSSSSSSADDKKDKDLD